MKLQTKKDVKEETTKAEAPVEEITSEKDIKEETAKVENTSEEKSTLEDLSNAKDNKKKED